MSVFEGILSLLCLFVLLLDFWRIENRQHGTSFDLVSFIETHLLQISEHFGVERCLIPRGEVSGQLEDVGNVASLLPPAVMILYGMVALVVRGVNLTIEVYSV